MYDDRHEERVTTINCCNTLKRRSGVRGCKVLLKTHSKVQLKPQFLHFDTLMKSIQTIQEKACKFAMDIHAVIKWIR